MSTSNDKQGIPSSFHQISMFHPILISAIRRDFDDFDEFQSHPDQMFKIDAQIRGFAMLIAHLT